MRRIATLLLTALLLPTLAPSVAAASTPVAATGPDADGVYTLLFDVQRDADGPAALRLDVVRDDAGDLATGSRDLGTRDLLAGTTRVDVAFVPAEGVGSYTVSLVVDGEASAPLVFDVDEGAGATAVVSFTVDDLPTYLNLTSDAVNADGKLKSPGEELITRATLTDGNGVSDVAVVYRVDQDIGSLHEGTVAVVAASNATSAPVELRYTRTPIAAGAHTMTLAARKDGADVATVTRTFAIRDVAAILENQTLPAILPDVWTNASATLVLADKNGVDPTHAIEARVYKGSVRVEGLGFAATLGAPTALPDANGHGRAALPLTLTVPARAASGAYRVSVYENGTLAGSAPFDVLPLPAFLNVTATPAGDALRLDVRASGAGNVRASLTNGEGSTTSATATLVEGNATLTLAAPATGTLLWSITLHARDDGPALDERNGTWERTGSPVLVITPIRPPPRFPATWSVEAPGYDLAGATSAIRVERWDGTSEPAITGTLADGIVRLDAPPTIAPGRYTARLSLTLPNGTLASASWSFEAGPWMRLAVSEPSVTGRDARVTLENAGGLAITKLVVETEGVLPVALETDGATLAPTLAGSRGAFAGLDVAPGESATLLVRLPDGPLLAGEHPAVVRFYALAVSSP